MSHQTGTQRYHQDAKERRSIIASFDPEWLRWSMEQLALSRQQTVSQTGGPLDAVKILRIAAGEKPSQVLEHPPAKGRSFKVYRLQDVANRNLRAHGGYKVVKGIRFVLDPR